MYIACLQSIPAVRRGRVVGGSNPGHKERDIMSQPALRLVEGSSMDKSKALSAALSQIERQFGKGSVMRMGDPGAPPSGANHSTATQLLRRQK